MIPDMPVYENKQFQAVFEKSAIPMATVTPAAEILSVNQVFAQFLGCTQDELVGKSVYDITHPADLEKTKVFYNDIAKGKCDDFSYEKRYFRQDGSIVWGLVTLTWLSSSGEKDKLCVAIIQDITNHKNAESQLQQSEELYRCLVENIDLGIALVDENHNILKLNNAVAQRFSKAPESFVGKKCFHAFEKKDAICQHCPGVHALKEGTPRIVETEGVRDDGSRFLVRLRAMPVFDSDGKARKFIEVTEDLTYTRGVETKLQQNQDRLNYLAHHDHLTGLPNRTLLYDRLMQALDRAIRVKEGLAIIVFALDHFQKINNILGYSVGNQVLKQVSKRLLAKLRKSDSLCLAGENEFVMILEKDSSAIRFDKVAQIILKSLNSKPFVVGGHELHISASVGVSHYPEDGDDVETLLRAAEVACTRAHEQGGNGYQYYRPEMEENSKRLLLLENLLHRALDEDQFTVYYQPQVNPISGQIIGMEALVRWNHPEMGQISPGEFIPLAEETGLILALGRKVLLKACQQAKEWLTAGLLDFRVAVNLSPQQITKGDLLKTIQKCLKMADLSPEYLELEITESALIENPELAFSMLQAIRNMGIRVALDDFGTGYSSLSYLKDFPVDRLKIAQEFIRNILVASKDVAIIQSVLALGRAFEINVIAEGVENIDQLELLLSMGCTQIQGYYFARPLEPKTATRYLKQGFGPMARSIEVSTQNPSK